MESFEYDTTLSLLFQNTFLFAFCPSITVYPVPTLMSRRGPTHILDRVQVIGDEVTETNILSHRTVNLNKFFFITYTSWKDRVPVYVLYSNYLI